MWRLCSEVVFKPKPLICKEVFFFIVIIIFIFISLLYHALFESCLVYEKIMTIGHRMILKTKTLEGCDVRIESVMSPPVTSLFVCSSLLCQSEGMLSLQKRKKHPSKAHSGFRKFSDDLKLFLLQMCV